MAVEQETTFEAKATRDKYGEELTNISLDEIETKLEYAKVREINRRLDRVSVRADR